MHLRSLSDLFLKELADLHSAEKQILKALPKMARVATTDDARQAFETHLEQTMTHALRLQRIFEEFEEVPGAKQCRGMEVLIAGGEEFLQEDAAELVRDAGLIAIAQRVEHYQIAAYGTASTDARQLGMAMAECLLRQNLREAEETDKTLTRLAESFINIEAGQSA
jgi:ferritin-like metal-binding protein YciE